MKKYLLALFLILPMMAHAECDCDEDDDDTFYQEYSYFGLKAGTGRYQHPLIQRSANSYGVYFGHRYSKMYALEFDYSKVGSYNNNISGMSGASKVVSLSAMHFWEINKNLSLIGRAGISYAGNGTSVPASSRHTDFIYGAGFDMRITSDVQMRVGYDCYMANFPDKARVTNTYLSFSSRF